MYTLYKITLIQVYIILILDYFKHFLILMLFFDFELLFKEYSILSKLLSYLDNFSFYRLNY